MTLLIYNYIESLYVMFPNGHKQTDQYCVYVTDLHTPGKYQTKIYFFKYPDKYIIFLCKSRISNIIKYYKRKIGNNKYFDKFILF